MHKGLCEMEYKQQVYELLNDFKAGRIGDAEFLKKLHSSEYTDLGFAMIDHERSLRQGFAEVVYCEGKTAEQTAAGWIWATAQAWTIYPERTAKSSCRKAPERQRYPGKLTVKNCRMREARWKLPDSSDEWDLQRLSAGKNDRSCPAGY